MQGSSAQRKIEQTPQCGAFRRVPPAKTTVVGASGVPERLSNNMDECPTGQTSEIRRGSRAFFGVRTSGAPTTVVFAGDAPRKRPGSWFTMACDKTPGRWPSQRVVAPMACRRTKGATPQRHTKRGNAPAACRRTKGATPQRHTTKPQVDGPAKGATPQWHAAVSKGTVPNVPLSPHSFGLRQKEAPADACDLVSDALFVNREQLAFAHDGLAVDYDGVDFASVG